jgi:hypothetical protein
VLTEICNGSSPNAGWHQAKAEPVREGYGVVVILSRSA